MADGADLELEDTGEAARPRKKARKPAEVPVETPAEDAAATANLRKKDLIDHVVAATGAKRRDVGPAVEATLAAIGEALERGEALTLPPLGRLRVVKRKDGAKAGGATLTLKLVRGGAKSAAGDGGLAEAEGSD
ncbi:MAG TPA: HU family DNA-binding protein [Paracoccaceae bacterium]|nr:HU family DNA-binding protein [Paracoccaceae bacterium]HMO70781.1 HU family DNA-binding protein [Paracoccaceae bacterium]